MSTPYGAPLDGTQREQLLAAGYTPDEVCDFQELMGQEWPRPEWTGDQVQALRSQVDAWRADPTSNTSVRADLVAHGYRPELIAAAMFAYLWDHDLAENAWTDEHVQGLRDSLDASPGQGRQAPTPRIVTYFGTPWRPPTRFTPAHLVDGYAGADLPTTARCGVTCMWLTADQLPETIRVCPACEAPQS